MVSPSPTRMSAGAVGGGSRRSHGGGALWLASSVAIPASFIVTFRVKLSLVAESTKTDSGFAFVWVATDTVPALTDHFMGLPDNVPGYAVFVQPYSNNNAAVGVRATVQVDTGIEEGICTVEQNEWVDVTVEVAPSSLAPLSDDTCTLPLSESSSD